MGSQKEFPEIMREARVDLAGNVAGKFSPEDWDQILSRAREQLEASKLPPHEAWTDVVRDFHRQQFWGFKPDFVPSKNPDEENLGVRMLLYSARSFLLTKVSVVWFGALWAVYDEPLYKYAFFGSIIFMVAAYGWFLYRYGNRFEK
jgi:hypothetical protein